MDKTDALKEALPTLLKLSFEDWFEKRFGYKADITRFPNVVHLQAAFEAGCNQPPLEGDVKLKLINIIETYMSTIGVHDEFFDSNDVDGLADSIIKQLQSTKPLEGGVKSAEEMYDEYYPHINVQRTDTLILMKAFARQFQSPKPVEGDVREEVLSIVEIITTKYNKSIEGAPDMEDEIVDALLSKYKFTRKG